MIQFQDIGGVVETMTPRGRSTVAPPLGIHNLIIVFRADPIICGHSTEARNLAEAAMAAGVHEVHIVSYPLEALEGSGLPLKPIESIAPYSRGIHIDRPAPVGDYKVLDGRLLYAMSGHLVDLLYHARGRTAIMDLYLVPHGQMVITAMRSFEPLGHRPDVLTIAEAVGSDITNVVNNALADRRMGAAQVVLSNYLMHDIPVAVSEYTKRLIVRAGEQVDAALGTTFAARLNQRVGISYPAIHTADYTGLAEDTATVDAVLARRGLERDGYLLFLSRIVKAKGVDDLIHAYKASALYGKKQLVICGTGNALPACRDLAAGDPHITFFDDVADEEKGALMHACAAYVFPSKPRPEFTETFGIAVAEKMLSGGPGPVITTRTGGIPEATGGHCLEHRPGDIEELTARLNDLAAMSLDERMALSAAAQEYALQFDRARVLERLLAGSQAIAAA